MPDDMTLKNTSLNVSQLLNSLYRSSVILPFTVYCCLITSKGSAPGPAVVLITKFFNSLAEAEQSI